jgi:hypothetical protein
MLTRAGSAIDATISELRISSSALGADENKAIYMSLFDTFIDYGAAEREPPAVPQPIQNWGGAVVLLFVTFVAMKERNVMTYTAAFLILATYGFAIGKENMGLAIATLCFAGFMLWGITQSFVRRA